MVHLLYWVFLLLAGWPQDGQQNIGTKLVWHYTSGTFAGGEVTTYTMADRRRTEYHNTSKNRNPDGSFSIGDPRANVVIQRCDLGQSFGLDTKTQEYSEKEYSPKPLTIVDSDTSKLPAFRVETTTVDTGERQEIYGQQARHVIITTKTSRLDDTWSDTSSVQHVSVKDGWYIDYDPRISCDPPAEAKPQTLGGFVAAGHLFPTEKTESIFIGQRENGLLVKGNHDSLTYALKGSNGVDLTLSNDIQVTDFYRGPLDPNLFEVPTGFKLVGTVLFQ